MNWKNYWNTVAGKAKNSIEAVQRNDAAGIELTANHIINSANIASTDFVLDLCCGNGLITNRIAKKCKNIIGVDQSAVLITEAIKTSNCINCTYINEDVLQINALFGDKKFDVIYIEFSFQYFDKFKKGEQLIAAALNLLNPNGRLFIGDIPDSKKLFVFYDTFPKKFYLLAGKIRNKNPMGKFWSKSELLKICDKFQVKGTYLKQNSNLPYAWYRFDFLIEK